MRYFTRSMTSGSEFHEWDGQAKSREDLTKRVRDLESKQLRQFADGTELLLMVTQLATKCQELEDKLATAIRRLPDGSGR